MERSFNLKDIVGHKEIINSLNNIVRNGKISNAYLFCGTDGIGKFLIAKEFAKSILCLNNKDGMYCDNCDSCKTFSSTSDLVILESEDGIIKIDSIRSLCKDVMLKPTISDRKVLIINDADTMGDPAQNALLKSLEEPPKYATIILGEFGCPCVSVLHRGAQRSASLRIPPFLQITCIFPQEEKTLFIPVRFREA